LLNVVQGEKHLTPAAESSMMVSSRDTPWRRIDLDRDPSRWE